MSCGRYAAVRHQRTGVALRPVMSSGVGSADEVETSLELHAPHLGETVDGPCRRLYPRIYSAATYVHVDTDGGVTMSTNAPIALIRSSSIVCFTAPAYRLISLAYAAIWLG